MKRLGTVHLLSHSGNLILRGNTVPRLGEDVFDSRLHDVGVVRDIFGPVTYPYISVTVKQDDPQTLVGKPLYLIGSKQGSAQKVNKWKGKNG